jgi:hypothetical protein
MDVGAAAPSPALAAGEDVLPQAQNALLRLRCDERNAFMVEPAEPRAGRTSARAWLMASRQAITWPTFCNRV